MARPRALTVTVTYALYPETVHWTLAIAVARAVEQACRANINWIGDPTVTVSAGEHLLAAAAAHRAPAPPAANALSPYNAGAGSRADSVSGSESGNLPGAGAGPYGGAVVAGPFTDDTD